MNKEKIIKEKLKEAQTSDHNASAYYQIHPMWTTTST
tara:strand:- start:2072 stop:2182 length:111 start_codon:yes stop_codon:yes gene_type:complete